MSISDDGKRVAFLGGEKGAEVICLDDQTLGRAGQGRVGVWPITMSGDGRTVAWRFSNPKDRTSDFDYRHSVVINGREHSPDDFAGRPAMSWNGRIVAWRATRNEQDDHYVRIGDREEGPYESTTDPVVTPDGSIVAYAFRREKKWSLKVGGRVTEIPRRPTDVFVSADGRHAGWVTMISRPDHGVDMAVEAFGTSGEAFSLVSGPSISPVEPLVLYGAESKGTKYVVLGTRKIKTPDRVGNPAFSRDGRKVGYGARIGNELWWKVLDVASFR